MMVAMAWLCGRHQKNILDGLIIIKIISLMAGKSTIKRQILRLK
jgi:hypothetical protein